MNKNNLSEKAHANAVKKGFWRERKGNEHCLMLVVTEISEMVEAFLEMMNHNDEDIMKEAEKIAKKYRLI